MYIVAVTLISGGNRSTRSTRRKPPTCHKSLTYFITQCCIENTSPRVIKVIRRVPLVEQELIILPKSPIFSGFVLFIYSTTCIRVFLFRVVMLLWFPYKNYLRFVFTHFCFVGSSCFIYFHIRWCSSNSNTPGATNKTKCPWFVIQ